VKPDLATLQKRRSAWAKEIGTGSWFAPLAPKIIAELDREIEQRKQS
jgi:hypothetical protein